MRACYTGFQQEDAAGIRSAPLRKDEKMTYTDLCREVRGANLVLVGIGEDLEGDLDGLYRSLSELLQKKDYELLPIVYFHP